MKRMIRVTSVLLVLLLGAVILSGCNTIEGAGEDIQRGGEAIEDAAD